MLNDFVLPVVFSAQFITVCRKVHYYVFNGHLRLT